LAIALQAYRDRNPSELLTLSDAEARGRLWDLLLETHAHGYRNTTPAQVRAALAWLAAGLERTRRQRFRLYELFALDPESESESDKHLRRFRIIGGLVIGLAVGLNVGLVVGPAAGLVIGLDAGLLIGLLVSPMPMFRTVAHGVVGGLITGLAIGLIGGIFGLVVDPLFGGGLGTRLELGLFFGLVVVLTIVRINTGPRRDDLQFGTPLLAIFVALVVGPVVGLVVGLVVGPVVGLISGLALALIGAPIVFLIGHVAACLDPVLNRWRIYGSQAFGQAARNAGRIARTGADVGLTVGLLVGLLAGLASGPAAGLAIGLTVGLTTGLAGGLDAWLYHYWLRRRLISEGVLPAGLPAFLQWCAEDERGWLRITDAYEFRHRELLDHLVAAEEIARASFFATPAEFRSWLERHHAERRELLVGFFREGSGRPSITRPQSVDEALCFGWVSSGFSRSLGDDTYTIRFWPEHVNRSRSAGDLDRVDELIEEGRMTPAGLAAFGALQPEHEARFRAVPEAWEWFQACPVQYRRDATRWVTRAKRPRTRERRLRALIENSAAGRGIKHVSSPESWIGHLPDEDD
jgi:uncharacterized protein YdeI (YjbR/CyaY-like superfamily)